MKLRTFFVAAVLGCLSACASVDTIPEDYQIPESFPRSYLAEFCYRPAPIVDEMVLIKEKKSYRLFEVTMEAGLEGIDDDSPITFEYYQRSGDAPSPVVLLLPILNGQKHVLRPFATHFAKHGYAVIIVDTVQRATLLEDLVHPEAAIQQTIQHHRRVIDWAESRPELDVTKLGVFGASLGGFNALFLAAHDERVDVVSMALVGGSLPHVMMTSTEGRIEESVGIVKEELSLDDEQLFDYLTEKIQTDTLTVAEHINAARVLLVLARFDNAVPYDSQLALRKAMGYPESITLPTGHYTAGLYLLYLRSRVLKFFDRKFAEASEHGTAVLAADRCDG